MAERRQAMPRGEGPLSLEEALRAWCDPVLGAEMIGLEEQGYTQYFVIIPGETTEHELKVDRYLQLRRQLEAEAIGYLRGGAWASNGFDRHTPSDSPAVALHQDRWDVLKADFKASTASGGGLEIFGIRVWIASSRGASGTLPAVPRLRIVKAARRAQLDGRDMTLARRSFDLLLVLAETAAKSEAPLPKGILEDRLISKSSGDKAIAQSVSRLRRDIARSSLGAEEAQRLIENQRTKGYRLALPCSDIRIDD